MKNREQYSIQEAWEILAGASRSTINDFDGAPSNARAINICMNDVGCYPPPMLLPASSSSVRAKRGPTDGLMCQ
jgi:hypothetical protein